MTDRELMQQALEALEVESAGYCGGNNTAKVLAALRERLAQPYCDDCGGTDPECPLAQPCYMREQPEQEPVAWMWRCKPYCGWPDWSVSLKRPADSGRDGNKRTEGYEDVPLYTAPQRRKWMGLTEEEIKSLEEAWEATPDWTSFADAVRAIEAKLRQKNT